MTTASVSIDRTSLSLPALVISGDGTGTYSLTKGGRGRPVVTPRYTTAADSPHLDGSLLTQVTREQSALPLEVLVQADSVVALEQAITDLEDALWQGLSYSVTVTVGGVAKTWTCWPTVPAVAGGAVEHAHVSEFFEVLAISIPVHPTPGV